MNEVWKDIPGYEGLYQVSDQGRVRSVDRVLIKPLGRSGKENQEVTYRLRGRVLRPNLNTHGYPYVILRRGGKSLTREIHKLVASAFLPAAGPGQVHVRHLDGSTKNPAATNLAWGTASENQLDLYAYRGYHHRLTPDDVKVIREELGKGVTGRELAERFKVSESNISEIKHRRSFKWLE